MIAGKSWPHSQITWCLIRGEDDLPGSGAGRFGRSAADGSLDSTEDPDSLIQQVTEQQKATNAGVLVIRPEMGNMTLQEAGDGMELFAREVLPALRSL
jgi:hypothetical protein